MRRSVPYLVLVLALLSACGGGSQTADEVSASEEPSLSETDIALTKSACEQYPELVDGIEDMNDGMLQYADGFVGGLDASNLAIYAKAQRGVANLAVPTDAPVTDAVTDLQLALGSMAKWLASRGQMDVSEIVPQINAIQAATSAVEDVCTSVA